MKINFFDYKQCFRVDPYIPVDALLKRGIFRAFELLIKKYPSMADQVRQATVNALNLLAQIDASLSNPTALSMRKQRKSGIAFYSSCKNALIEFKPKRAGKFNAEGHDMTRLLNAKPKLSKKQQANIAFKRDASKYLESYATDEVEKTMLQGVFFVLATSEDFAGPTIDVFKAQQPLFVKLRQIYEVSDLTALDSIRGDYNEALAVEVSSATEERLGKNADLKKEEDAFFDEG